jgi:hypothetical protein
MVILNEFAVLGGLGPLSRAQTFVLEHLISLHCASGDVRWAIIALALRSFIATWVFAQEQFVLLVRSIARRVRQRACLAAIITNADTTVAAGGN